MGNAQAMVVNKTHKKICVITFNQTDLLMRSYHSMYILEPAETKQVEANSDPNGLKIAIVYDAQPDGQVLLYQRWGIKNASVITITQINNDEISIIGEGYTSQGKGKVKEKDETAFATAIDALTYQSPIERSNARR